MNSFTHDQGGEYDLFTPSGEKLKQFMHTIKTFLAITLDARNGAKQRCSAEPHQISPLPPLPGQTRGPISATTSTPTILHGRKRVTQIKAWSIAKHVTGHGITHLHPRYPHVPLFQENFFIRRTREREDRPAFTA